MSQNTFGPHELLELHEILASEITAAQKMQTAMGTVNDSEFHSFIKMSLNSKQKRISTLEQLAQSAMQPNT